MIERVGDIWIYYREGSWIVIATNIGWKKNGANPMGAGIAAKAADLYPELPGWYGARCKKYKANTAVCPFEPGRFFLFPTKSLDEQRPWLSWQAAASIHRIRRSAYQLAELAKILRSQNKVPGEIILPMVGCGNGRLSPKDVVPVLRDYLDDSFVLVEPS
jgi:hypothetical protein